MSGWLAKVKRTSKMRLALGSRCLGIACWFNCNLWVRPEISLASTGRVWSAVTEQVNANKKKKCHGEASLGNH